MQNKLQEQKPKVWNKDNNNCHNCLDLQTKRKRNDMTQLMASIFKEDKKFKDIERQNLIQNSL